MDQTSSTPPAAPVCVRPAQSAGGVSKDTIESILIAFILAFIFRAFVVEAFVIPTGSMAPTLMGAHVHYVCPDCGYAFDVNYPVPEDADLPDPPRLPAFARTIICPNCGYKLPPSQTLRPWIDYGDRILVLKYLYMNQKSTAGEKFLFHRPARWDVVVFKSPTEQKKYDFTQNYIKRLVGRPGETLMVLDGDVYIKEPGQSRFMVQTKPADAQDALWRLVYNNDYHSHLKRDDANGQAPFKQPWTNLNGTDWKTATPGGRVFSHAESSRDGTLFFDAAANPLTHCLSDYVAYDQMVYQNGNDIQCWAGNPVSDLKLELVYTRQKGPGPLRLTLTKLDEAFIAQIAPDGVKLLRRQRPSGTYDEQDWLKTSYPEKQMAAAPLPPGVSADAPMHIEFTNVDYQVTLKINGRTVIQTTPAQYAPDIEDLIQRTIEWHRYWTGNSPIDDLARRSPFGMPAIAITAGGQACTIQHLGLWRDVYYTPWGFTGNGLHQGGAPNVPGAGGPVTLGKDDYFVMGDNSIYSYDSRYWTEHVNLIASQDLAALPGRVPEKLLLGKAFFVYWPAGHRLWKPVIPDFGRMRFIH